MVIVLITKISEHPKVPEIEQLLDLDSGKTVSIIQEEGDYAFAAGQRVKIIKNKGKSRVMPLK